MVTFPSCWRRSAREFLGEEEDLPPPEVPPALYATRSDGWGRIDGCWILNGTSSQKSEFFGGSPMTKRKARNILTCMIYSR